MSSPATRLPPRAASPSPERRGGTTDWGRAGGESRSRRRPRWRSLLWALLYPPRGHRISPTLAGGLLVAVSLGIGLAAYNTANNILFITLSLLLSCLILSGLLSWANLRGVAWRLHADGPWRVGQSRTVALELRNDKRILPTYGLWFDLVAGSWSGRTHLETRLDPESATRLEWSIRPERRGPLRVHLAAIGSLFPFGFLRKAVASGLNHVALVWPAAVDYRQHGSGLAWRPASSQGQVNRAGHGDDLHAVRPYVTGDSPRLLHWKASARLRRLLVRQFSAEGQEGFVLRLDLDPNQWTRPEQFELGIALAATLAEDLFKQGRLRAVAIGCEVPRPTRRLRDVEWYLDQLALATPTSTAGLRPASSVKSQYRLLDIQPDGARGVVALLDGKPAASA